MAMLDTEIGQGRGSGADRRGVDGCAFDEATQLAFASCGEGVTMIAKEKRRTNCRSCRPCRRNVAPARLRSIRKTHRIYLPTAHFQPPLPPGAPIGPAIVPNTMKLAGLRTAESAKH